MNFQKRREKKLTALHYQGKDFATTLTKEKLRLMQFSQSTATRLMAAREMQFLGTPQGYQVLIDGEPATNVERKAITFPDKGMAERQVRKHRPDLA